MGETLTDLQIWGCELHKNAFGGRAPPEPAGGSNSAPQIPSRYNGRERGKGKKFVGNSREERKGKERT